MSVKISDNNKIPELIENLTGMKNRTIEAGILEGGKQAMIAHVHEYGVSITVTPRMRAFLHYNDIHLREGTTQINIPERSYIRKYADEDLDKAVKNWESLVGDVIELKIDAETFLEMAGEEMADGIKEKISSVSEPPLTDWTKDWKGSSKPLEDTGSLSDSMNYRVR